MNLKRTAFDGHLLVVCQSGLNSLHRVLDMALEKVSAERKRTTRLKPLMLLGR